MAAAGVADRPAAGQQRRQGDAGAAETGRSAAADQQEDGGGRPGYLRSVYRPQHSTGPGSALTLSHLEKCAHTIVCLYFDPPSFVSADCQSVDALHPSD